MTRRFLRASVLLILLLTTASLSNSALAGHEQGPTFSTPRPLDSSLMEAFQKNLSGSSWLMAEGLDPRLTTLKGNPLGREFPPQEAKIRGISPQAGGGGQGPLVPYRSPSPKFSRNILVTRDFSRAPFQTEPHLAVDPKDPEHLILGVIDYSFPGITTYNSIDGGATWEGPYQVKYPSGDLGGAGDPVIAFDRQGNAYAASISMNVEEFTIRNAVGDAAVSSIPISASSDGGFTWAEPIASAQSHVDTGPATVDADGRTTYELLLPFLDKPWVTVGPSSEDPDKDVIYVTYTKFLTILPVFFLFDVEAFVLVPRTETSIELVRSEDGGLTWSDPVTVSPIVVSTQGEDAPKRVVQGSQPAVAPDGTVYVNWMDSTDDDSFKGRAEIYVARSEDNGRTFVRNRASDFNELPFSPRNTFFRYWGATFPQISTGPQGEIYIVYTGLPSEKKTDDGDIYFVASTDRGETWTPKKKLNDDETNRLQFFPSISAGPDGTIHAMWGDMRDDPVETRYNIYYASSDDGGKTWIENARVTDFPSNPNHAFPGGAFIGDYFTIAATEDDVYMAWPDARLGEFGAQNQKIAFARTKLMPLPSIFLSPPSGPGGKDITIQGSNFQPDQDVFLEISGAVVSAVRSDADGRFTARLFIPISGEGAHDFRAIDASGNIATSSFFMDFGFDNIQGSIGDIIDQLDSLDGASGGQLQSIQDSLGQFQTTLEGVEADGDSEGIKVWMVIIIALIVAVVASYLGLLAGSLIARGRSA
ncbi:MAG: BNR-4 repeat-containing protein [Chloroflexi bacterium]|nr:BNR-4 repeat-containing protein [Chloroflexota bacterium]